MTRMMSLLSLPLIFAACDAGEKVVWPDPPPQLEALSIETGDLEFAPLDLSGTLSVEGAEGDYVLTLTPAEGEPMVVPVHSPAGTDLSTLAGEARTLHLLSAEVFEQRSVAVSDADGVLWVGDIGANAAEVGALIGAPAPDYGAEQSRAEDDTFNWSFTTAKFTADDGEVELLPGEVQTLQLGGALYKVTVVAAYQRESKPGAALPGCPFLEDLLSYELERVATASEASLKERPEGLSEARIGCGD